MRATFELSAARGPETIRALAHMLEGLTRIDADQMEGGGLPPLYTSGVRYRSEVTRRNGRTTVREDWKDARSVIACGHADCEDLASYRAAELRASGVDAIALPFYVRPGLIHCVVYAPALTSPIEDPSRLLGMPELPGRTWDTQIAEALGVILQ